MARRIGVAFGGGAARGVAHVGVIRALRNHPRSLPVKVTGTSAGSIIAVLYAAGLPQLRLEEISRNFDWLRDVIDLSDTVRVRVRRGQRGGLVSNAALGASVEGWVEGRSFDDLGTDVAVVAGDLEHRRRIIMTSRRVAERLRRRQLDRYLPPPAPGLPGCETIVLSDVPVGLAVRASCAVPGVFVPVEIQGMHLVDGGVVDQVPVDVVRAMGATFAVGVSLAMWYAPEKIGRPVSAVSAMMGLFGQHMVRRGLDMADVGFQISGIESRSLVDTHQADLLDLGERDAERYLAGRLWPRSREGRRERARTPAPV